jgi:acetyl-CoA carboxylase biotin carboxyl carrier protein
MIDLDWIRELIDLVDESEVDTLEVSRFATKVRISKSPPGTGIPASPSHASAPPSPAHGSPPSPAGGEAGSSGGAAPPAGDGGAQDGGTQVQTEEASTFHEVTSPMVGTFYRAPAPDAPPYVEEGERVQEGQTLCILEAMKLMNELESEVSGEIREICVENAEPVEYGQVLFRIDTSA